MNHSNLTYRRSIWLGLLLGIFSLFLLLKAPIALAADYILDWSQIGFVDGNSGPQTFNNVAGSGVDMTVEIRVLNSSFQDTGAYIPGTTPLNQDMPKVVVFGDNDAALSIRDINEENFPDAGYILTKITFSTDVKINELWMDSFYHYTNDNVLKHLALQAFDAEGNGLVPQDHEIVGSGSPLSEMITTAHPTNGESWWRSSFPITQTNFTGAIGINYGNQAIRELHWYSWGYDPADGTTLQHVLGSTYLGNFQFSTFPTAVTLVSLGAADRSAALGSILLVVFLFSLVTLAIMHRRPLPAVS
jgi:hypothetical protein